MIMEQIELPVALFDLARDPKECAAHIEWRARAWFKSVPAAYRTERLLDIVRQQATLCSEHVRSYGQMNVNMLMPHDDHNLLDLTIVCQPSR